MDQCGIILRTLSQNSMVMLGPGNGVGGTNVVGSRIFSSTTFAPAVDGVSASCTGAQSTHVGSDIVVAESFQKCMSNFNAS